MTRWYDEIVKPVKGKRSFNPGTLSVMVSNANDLFHITKAAGIDNQNGYPFVMSRMYSNPASTFSLIGPVVGAPYAVLLMENLAVWGMCEMIYIGWCGSISRDVEIGDILIPAGAIIDEGASVHYNGKMGETAKPAPDTVNKLKTAFKTHNVHYHQGIAWTTDGIFRETPHKTAFFRSKGAVAVEMETSALFSAAAFRGLKAGAVLVVSDDLSSGQWRHGFKSPRFLENRQRIAEAVASLLAAS